MLEKSGDTEEGRRLMDLARLLPLADAAQRRVLADGLKERGMIDDAVREWELVLRTTAFRDWYSSNAAMNLGNVFSGKRHLAAADNWELLALSVLKKSSSFIEVEGYLQLPHLVHKSRARGLLATGLNDEALANLWISHAAYPGSIDLAEDLIPELEAAGLRSTADELFQKVYVPNEQIVNDHPENASAHNNLAWLAARGGRRLEEALAHARRAVEIEPENTAYLDTLAEALYQSGDREEAIEVEARCLESEPDNEHFQAQLKRFKAGEE
jgi:tetratricopeptide (TPR) repeat protein